MRNYILENGLVIKGSKDTSCLYEWDENCQYFSLNIENSSLFLSFSPLKSFKLISYKILGYAGNAFPLKWEISGSNDNLTYHLISNENSPLCSGDEVEIANPPNSYSDHCKKGTIKEYFVYSTKFYKYIRYMQIGYNSCQKDTSNCKGNSILIAGIDINCQFFKGFTAKSKNDFFKFFIFTNIIN